MVIHSSNLISPLFSVVLPSALNAFLSSSDEPFKAFLSLSRLSLLDALGKLASFSDDKRLRALFEACSSSPHVLRRFSVSEFYTGLLSDPHFSVLDPAVSAMFGRAYYFAHLLNDVRSSLCNAVLDGDDEFAIVITSGYRSSSHNAACGGVPNSNHTKGFAVDVACPPGITFSSFLSTLKKHLSLRHYSYVSVELIPYRKRRFIHIAL